MVRVDTASFSRGSRTRTTCRKAISSTAMQPTTRSARATAPNPVSVPAPVRFITAASTLATTGSAAPPAAFPGGAGDRLPFLFNLAPLASPDPFGPAVPPEPNASERAMVSGLWLPGTAREGNRYEALLPTETADAVGAARPASRSGRRGLRGGRGGPVDPVVAEQSRSRPELTGARKKGAPIAHSLLPRSAARSNDRCCHAVPTAVRLDNRQRRPLSPACSRGTSLRSSRRRRDRRRCPARRTVGRRRSSYGS